MLYSEQKQIAHLVPRYFVCSFSTLKNANGTVCTVHFSPSVFLIKDIYLPANWKFPVHIFTFMLIKIPIGSHYTHDSAFPFSFFFLNYGISGDHPLSACVGLPPASRQRPVPSTHSFSVQWPSGPPLFALATVPQDAPLFRINSI